MFKTKTLAMNANAKLDFGIRSKTLIQLRWIAVAGQLCAILFVTYGLHFSLPLLPCLGAIGFSAVFNLLLSMPVVKARLSGQSFTFGQLVFDIMQMALLLGLTGGLANPFVVLLGVPVVVAVTALPLRIAIALAMLTVAAAILLGMFWLPLPWAEGQAVQIPKLFISGQITAFFTATAFIAMFVWRVSVDGRHIQEALMATEAVLATQSQLSALGGLAAAAAHELGTPLGTIALVAKEMSHSVPKESELADDAKLLVEQAQRCRKILSKLSAKGTEADPVYTQIRLSDLLEEIATPLRENGVDVHTGIAQTGNNQEGSNTVPMPVLRRQAEILYALSAFADNAADFAKTRIRLSGQWDEDSMEISIHDDGPGFSDSVLKKLGEPYITTRAGGDARGHGGMGLGVFIGKTLIERTQGGISFNKSAALGGAEVRILWPRAAVEMASP